VQMSTAAGTIGTLNVSGSGEFTATNTNGFAMGTTSGSTSTVNLDGGTFTLGTTMTATGTSTLNFNSGVFRAGTDILLPALTRINVRDGGAVFDTNGKTMTIDQALSHSDIGGDATTDGGLIKDGNGTLILGGVNTYNGPTEVYGGTLVVNGSIFGSPITTVSAGATLKGGGTIGALDARGNVQPGDNLGVLTTNGDATFISSATLSLELNNTTPATGYDQLAVNGVVNLGNANLSLGGSYLTFPAIANDLFFVIINDGVDSIGGIFNGIPDGGHVFAQNGQDFILTYFADSGSNSFTGGNDVALLAVPEPGSAALMLGGLAMLAFRRRRA
jgi:autotransporter-associated beta strand protein